MKDERVRRDSYRAPSRSDRVSDSGRNVFQRPPEDACRNGEVTTHWQVDARTTKIGRPCGYIPNSYDVADFGRALKSEIMKNLGRPSSTSAQHRLLSLLTSQFDDASHAYDLFSEFLEHKGFSKSLCLKLVAAAQDRAGSAWDI